MLVDTPAPPSPGDAYARTSKNGKAGRVVGPSDLGSSCRAWARGARQQKLFEAYETLKSANRNRPRTWPSGQTKWTTKFALGANEMDHEIAPRGKRNGP